MTVSVRHDWMLNRSCIVLDAANRFPAREILISPALIPERKSEGGIVRSGASPMNLQAYN